jgi:hypothetical protein
MPDIRESINEMIEESYLLNLSESEIKADLDRFVEICGRVVYENIHDRKQMQELTEKLARARALSLIEDHQDDEFEPALDEDDDRTTPSARDHFVERVARNKRLILKAVRECDPRLEGLIDEARFPTTGTPPSSPPAPDQPKPKAKAKDLALKTVYAVALLAILLLVYLMLLQNV